MFFSIRRRQVAARRACLLLVLPLLCLVKAAHAHEIRPAVVDMSVAEEGVVRFDIQLNLEAVIAGIGPQHSDTSESPNAAEYDALRALPPEDLGAEFERFRARFLDGINIVDAGGTELAGGIEAISIAPAGDTDVARTSSITITVPLTPDTESIVWSWDRAFGAVILRVVEPETEDGYSVYLAGGDATDPIPVTGGLRQTRGNVFLNYLVIGFAHIVPKGLDHILFVVGLFLLSTRLKPLLVQVTSFTLAHSVTLALGVLGVVALPPSIVEPLIAASIVYVAVENIISDKLHRWRPVVVFGFGLLHGLGFAGVLSEIGIAENYFVTALAAFNIGVELGQIAVILGCFLLVGIWFRRRSWYRMAVTIPASVIVAVVGAYWFVERTLLA